MGSSVRSLYSTRCALAALSLLAAVGLAGAQDFSASVVRVRATAAEGSVKLGSGVAIAPGRFATACHVTRGAATIEIVHGTDRWIVDAQVGSPHHDLCLLSAPAIDVPVARMRPSEDLNPEESVIAIGFQGGERVVAKPGNIAALYPHDGGNVIRTSASFDFGSSGGGLFDQAGNLVGILAFRARTGESLRFALPTEWISPESTVGAMFVRVTATSLESAFWEHPRSDRPAFLGVALREAAGQRP